mgnify:FL=1
MTNHLHLNHQDRRRELLRSALALGLLVLLLGVSACGVPPSQGREMPTPPLPAKTRRPTFTPTPPLPPTPTPQPAIPTPTPVPDTPTPLPTTPPPPTDTPVPPTPTPEPSPVVEVTTENLNVRSGPGTAYARVGQVKQGDRLEVLAQSPAGEWYLVCCVGGEQGWVSVDYVRLVQGTTAAIPISTAVPPTPKPQPTNTPAPPPTATPVPATPTPVYQFVGREVTGYAYDKPYLTVKGKIWDAKAQKALPGYRFKVFRNGADAGFGEVSQPGFSDATCSTCGDNRKVNVKYEYNPAGDATWEVYVVDGNGVRVSESLTFNTSTANPQWFYVEFALR